MRLWRRREMRALRALAIVAAFAPTGCLEAQPLSPREFEAVVAEIQAMVKTDENDVTRFVVREATPQKIVRFYAMPEIADLPAEIRANGLIFGGLGGNLLDFDRPADVLAKMERWFPAEFTAARDEGGLARGGPHLFGPYENWEPEPTAFMVLWKCYPRSAWFHPNRQPFARPLNSSHPMMPIAAKSSSEQEFDFGFCARENAGYRPPRMQPELPAAHARARAVGEVAATVLPLVDGAQTEIADAMRAAGLGAVR